MTREVLIWRFAIQQLIHWTIVGIAIPVLILLFQARGFNLQDIGLVMAVWVGSTAVLEVPLGGVADRYGRKATYLGSLVVNILGCSALLYVTELVEVLFSAFMLGASRAIYSGTLDAWFYDAFQQCRQQCRQRKLTFHTAQSYVNMSVTLGLALGSLLGGWLPDYVVSTGVQWASIYDLNLVVVIVANSLLITTTAVLIREKREQDNVVVKVTHLSVSVQVLSKAFSHDVIKRLMQTTIVYGAVLSAVETFWQPYLMSIIQTTTSGPNESRITLFGLLAGLYFLMAALSSWCAIRLLAFCKGSHKALMFWTRVLAGAALIMMANTNETWAFACFYLVFFFLFTLGNSSQSVLLNEYTESQYRSTMLSVSSLVVTCGAVVASLLFGFISEHYGISLSWLICGGTLVVSSAWFVLIPDNHSAAAQQ
ncbi:hypothetical protein RJ45_19265 [Photobacterium gaetbulicola]|uniref:Major facilitator superfamily (MFS) profile domain-containing protein n=1 Tax=Photobacterium gaetbulicola TaxID=1295392 RepID=A0A0B9G0D8_9GAMM|nr:MFS transporter [Photobacterium gaetbulicola]KHT62064.1 hypothetical protein RJ45_19265 [Photobacterium gaetbulicola]